MSHTIGEKHCSTVSHVATPAESQPPAPSKCTHSAAATKDVLAPSSIALAPARSSLAERLRAGGFSGEILEKPADLARYSGDYGRIITGTPRLVVKPKTTEDVQRVVHLAIDAGVSVRARSGGHALEGQSLAENGIVIASDDLRLPSGAKFELDESGRVALVRTIPGVNMGELTRFLASKGYRLRTATMDDYPGVGGALSSAGTGRGSHVHGTMTEQCMRLVGVTGTGARIDVRSERSDYSQFSGAHGDVADLMLGSFGQAGVITELSLPIVKVKGQLRRFREPLPSLEALRKRIDDIIAAKNEDVWAVWGVIAKDPKSGRAVYLAGTIRDVSDGSGDPITSIPDPGADPAVLPAWLSVIFPSTDRAMQALAKNPGFFGEMTNPGLILLIPQKKMRADRLTLNTWSKAGTGDMMMGLGVFYYGQRDDATRQVEAFRASRRELAQKLDGQHYLTEGLPRQSAKARDEWRAILGADAYTRIVTALDKADPYGVFARLPGLERLHAKVQPAR